MYNSSNFDPSLERAQYFDIIKQAGGDFLDVLDGRLISRIREIRSWTPYQYEHGANLPNLSYRFYGKTTAYWIIAIYNGIVDPLSIQEGQVLKIPAFSEITRALADAQKRKRQSANTIASTVTI